MHLVAQLIRHHRGIATALEKWADSPGFSRNDARDAVGYMRKVLDGYERALVNGTVDAGISPAQE